MELAPVILLLWFLKHMIGNMTFIMTWVKSSIKKSGESLNRCRLIAPMSELDLSLFVYLVPLGLSWPSSLVWPRWKPNFINDMKKRKWSQKWVSIIRYQIILSLIARVECRQCLNLIWHLSWCLLCIYVEASLRNWLVYKLTS
jgi:hypothetical protein